MKEPKNWKRLFAFLLMVLLTCLLFAAASADSVQYIVSSNSSPVNVRGAASRDSSVVAKLKTGTQVTVIGEEGNWSHIQYDGRYGYVMSIFLSSRDPSIKVDSQRYVKSPNSMPVNVREDAGKDSKVTAKLVTGTEVTVTEVGEEWIGIRVQGSGEEGYVLASFLTRDNPYEVSTGKNSGIVYLVSENDGSINIREKADKTSKLVDQVPSGTQAELISAGSVWSKIQTDEGITGFVINDLISRTPASPDEQKSVFMYVVSPDSMSVNFRASNSRSSKVIDQLVTGTKVEVLSSDATWSEIEVNGKTGYIMNMYLSKDTPVEYQKGTTATVSAPDGGTVRMRYGAGKGYDVVTKVESGTKVEVLASIKGWARVRWGSYEGYIDEQYLIK